jgi:hypothetical protein
VTWTADPVCCNVVGVDDLPSDVAYIISLKSGYSKVPFQHKYTAIVKVP